MSEGKMVHRAYSGNIKSERLTIFELSSGFEFIYQKFKRTNPSQAERKLDIKPKRNLLSEAKYFYPNLDDVDLSDFPFFHLMKDFKP